LNFGERERRIGRRLKSSLRGGFCCGKDRFIVAAARASAGRAGLKAKG